MYTGWFNCNCFLAPTTHFPDDSATQSSECSLKGVEIWLIYVYSYTIVTTTVKILTATIEFVFQLGLRLGFGMRFIIEALCKSS